MASLDEKHRASVAEGDHAENVELKDVNPASAALAAAVARQKPNPWSKNMLKLYSIMSIGYLVSTMNGFGESPGVSEPGSFLLRSADHLGRGR